MILTHSAYLGILLMKKLVILSFFLGVVSPSYGEEQPFEIWLDGDFTNHLESSQSIEMGAQAAISDFGELKSGRKVVVIRRDHRGSSKRSLRNIKNFIGNANGIAMMSGIHSPPLLAHREFINNSKVPFLVPWAAAGPITRGGGDENYIFRLSIDDSKAGDFISQYASRAIKSKYPCLLLEDTGWGKSNFKNMTNGFNANNVAVHRTLWFRWGIKKNVAGDLAHQLYTAKCDLVLLVANSKEGALLVKAIAGYPGQKTLPILSHWGITGGSFHEEVSHTIRSKVNLKFIQTNFNFNQNSSQRGKLVLETFRKKFGIKEASEIKAGTGASHAYDLTTIFLNALNNIDQTKPSAEIRILLQKKLETLNLNYKGLIKTYQRPFGRYSVEAKDAHEALDQNDYSIGFFNEDGVILNVGK